MYHCIIAGFWILEYINLFLLFYSWYFGDVSSTEAEELLLQPSADQESFLIRKSDKRFGEYSISLRHLKEVKHCEIYRVDDGFYLSPKERFESISELVTHYNKQSLPTVSNQNIKLKSVCPRMSETADSSRKDDIWETNRESICFVKKIGTGKFCELWEAILNDATSVAVKMPKVDDKDAKKFLLKEIEILKQLKHPNMIQLYAVCTKEEPIYIITELMKHGSLLEYLKGDGSSLELLQLINMMSQVAAGMAYLGKNNYIHRDLAARNVAVADGLVCKLADFSSAQPITSGVYEAHIGKKLPIKWTAPEVVTSYYFTIKSDVWSFGILIYELVTHGHSPYPGMSNAQVTSALKTGYRMPCPHDCPEQLYEIMTDCWKDDTTFRPTFEALQRRLEGLYAETEHTCSNQVKLIFTDKT